MTFDTDFKEAIKNLSVVEKDRLLLRLLKKDLILAQRLHFELLDPRTVDDRRTELEDRITMRISKRTQAYRSPGYLLMEMRDISAEITLHVKITKDVYGEVSLNLRMLTQVLEHYKDNILKSSYGRAYKLCIYIIARIFKILIGITKLHEDCLIDFEDHLQRLGELIPKNVYVLKAAEHNGLEVDWLLGPNVPENMYEIHKDLRSQGYLRMTQEKK